MGQSCEKNIPLWVNNGLYLFIKITNMAQYKFDANKIHFYSKFKFFFHHCLKCYEKIKLPKKFLKYLINRLKNFTFKNRVWIQPTGF